ncbi:MAG TPA: hypothetical protein VLF42_12150 [Burkholderiales bacterium]|nr:hypothetical protein [Burkholderiales bacterium]
MEFRQVESLRNAKLEQRAAAAAVAAPAPARFSLPQRMLWCLVQVLRHAWLNVYPLLALVAGVVFIAAVEQTREILANLEQELLFLAVLAAWAASIWYTMRVLSSTDFPGDAEPHPAAKACTGWLNGESPRLAAFAGLALTACSSSIFLTENPHPNWIAPLAAGVVPVTWAAAWLCDRLARLRAPLRERPVYRWSVLLVALAAAALASYSWSTVPQPMRAEPKALHLEDWLLIGCVALTLVPLVFRRRGAIAHWAMAAAFALWLWVVYKTAGNHPGSPLPHLALALAGFGLWFTERRRELLGIEQAASVPDFEVGAQTFAALGIALALQLALVIALTLSPIGFGMRVGTLGILFLALAILAFFGIVWVFLPKYATWPSLALVPLVWGFVFGNEPEHGLRGTRFALEPPERPRLAEHFDQWRARELPDPQASPVFVVAAAGGGLRAAYWTATILATADDRTCGEFGRHAYAYSGVSGGALGIAAYLAQRQVWQAKPPAERCKHGRAGEIARLLGRDFLAPVAGSLLFAEMAQRFVPFEYLDEDRGSTLARAWSAAWDDVFPQAKGRFDLPFLEALAPGSSPAVFLNATAVESGQRVIATNVSVFVPDSIDLFRPVRKTLLKKSGLELRRLDLKTSGLTLREAVLNSARFTYVSPAATVLGCERPGAAGDGSCARERLMLWDRVVDGGYFENSGVATLADVVRRLAPRKGQMYAIVIDNSNESELACRERVRPGTDSDLPDEPPAARVPVLSGVTAPIETLLHVREARGRLEVRRLASEFPCSESRILDWNLFGDRVERAKAEAAGQEPALGWLLSRRSAAWIGERAAQVAAQFPFSFPVPASASRP